MVQIRLKVSPAQGVPIAQLKQQYSLLVGAGDAHLLRHMHSGENGIAGSHSHRVPTLTQLVHHITRVFAYAAHECHKADELQVALHLQSAVATRRHLLRGDSAPRQRNHAHASARQVPPNGIVVVGQHRAHGADGFRRPFHEDHTTVHASHASHHTHALQLAAKVVPRNNLHVRQLHIPGGIGGGAAARRGKTHLEGLVGHRVRRRTHNILRIRMKLPLDSLESRCLEWVAAHAAFNVHQRVASTQYEYCTCRGRQVVGHRIHARTCDRYSVLHQSKGKGPTRLRGCGYRDAEESTLLRLWRRL